MRKRTVWVVSPYKSWCSGICRYMEEVFPDIRIRTVSNRSDAENLNAGAQDVGLIHHLWIPDVPFKSERIIPVHTGKDVLETDITIYDTGTHIAGVVENRIRSENIQQLQVIIVAGDSRSSTIATSCADALAGMKKNTICIALTPKWNGASECLGYQELLYRSVEGQRDMDLGKLACRGRSGFYQPVLKSGIVALEDWSEQVVTGLIEMFQNAGVQYLVIDGGTAVGRAWRNWGVFSTHILWTLTADQEYMTELSRWTDSRAGTKEWLLVSVSEKKKPYPQKTILYHPDVLAIYGQQEGAQILRQMEVIT